MERNSENQTKTVTQMQQYSTERLGRERGSKKCQDSQKAGEEERQEKVTEGA